MTKNLKKFFRERKGQVGVGTLIIFIAMILVAAVAAGVLLRTTGGVQTKATETAEKAGAEVSTNIRIIDVIGETADNANITDIRLKINLLPGAEALKETDFTLGIRTAKYLNSSLDFTGKFLKNVTADEYLEVGEIYEITIDLDGIGENAKIEPNTEFTLTLVPKVGVPTSMTLTSPKVISSAQTYYPIYG